MKKILIGFLLFFSFQLFAQKEEEKIAWTQDIKLSWKDFKATPNPNHSFDAMTNSGISYSYSYATGPEGIQDFEYSVESFFYPQRSWVKKGEESEHLLAHEQLHFDISELHARILNQKLLEYVPNKNIKRDLKKIYTEVERAREKMQNLYDKETKHSQDKAASAKWQKLVEQELEKHQETTKR